MITPKSDDAILPAATCARIVGVSPPLLQRWRTKGWIDPQTGARRYLTAATVTPTGRPLYRLGDARQAERDTWRNPRSHRLPLPHTT